MVVPRDIRSRLLPYAVSAASVAVVGVAAGILMRHLPLPHVSILFIAAVLTSAALWGFWPSVFAALLSAGAESFFFYSPIFSFHVADPQQVADLAVFLVIAALTSWLAARVRAQALEAHRRQDELREALLNSVSHDLKTPLAAILGSATALQTLAEQGDPRARAELAAAIRDQAERLASDIENVLDLTRIRAGGIAPRLELVELADIVDAALRRKQRLLAAHPVEVALPPDLPMLRLDLFLMEHALANLIDNAAKHARPGSPLRISAAVQNGGVALDVTDRGEGIPEAELERIFEPFYRGTTAAGGGTGLGLAICRAFVQANAGSVAALSAGPGQGTTVRIRLPVPEDAAESAPSDD
jgi:K+-sensing histidine kinase KdpD